METLEMIKPIVSTLKNLPLVFRYDSDFQRYYFTVREQQVTFYPSVTHIIDKTMPMSFGLRKLIGDLGLKDFYTMMRQKGHYGTMLHILIAKYIKYNELDLDSIQNEINLYKEDHFIDFSINDWLPNLKRDVLALITFCNDYRVEPIGIEVVGTYTDGTKKFAGAIDLICTMNIIEKGYFGEVYKSGERKGEPKESTQIRKINAIVDFKSGKSGFFETHEIQLNMYKMMAEQTFGIKIDKIFNVAPKDWISSPTYHVKDQTESIHAKKIPFLLELFNIEYEEPKDVMSIEGKVNGNYKEIIRYVPAKEYVLNLAKVQYASAFNN